MPVVLGPAAAAGAAIGVTVSAAEQAAQTLAAGFAAFMRRRSGDVFPLAIARMQAADPGMDAPTASRLATIEAGYEAEYQRKALARITADLRIALANPDPEARRQAVRALLERERRYQRQREEAISVRALARAEQNALRRTSPQGAYWMLSDYVREHTLDCLGFASQFWPWRVLERQGPPRHHGCPCYLIGLDEAKHLGLMTDDDVPDPADAERRARLLLGDLEEVRHGAALAVGRAARRALEEGNLAVHAERELRRAGLFDRDSDYGGMVGTATLDLVRRFGEQGHSGFSAGLVRDLFGRLAAFEALTPLTDDPDEWNDVSAMSGTPLWQSRRDSTAFSEDAGKTYTLLADAAKTTRRSQPAGPLAEHGENATLGFRIMSEIDGSLEEAERGRARQAYDLRYARGTVKGGQFRPRRGGHAARLPPRMNRERGRWTAISGHPVRVPERRWTRRVAGATYSSPAGSTNVYREGQLVDEPGREPRHRALLSPPITLPGATVTDVPADRAAGVLAALREITQARRDPLRRRARDALARGVAPVEVGAGPDAIAALRAEGFTLRPSANRLVLQHPAGTLRLRLADGAVTEVGWTPKPRAARRPVALARPPVGWNEHAADALALADELGARYGAVVRVPRVLIDDDLGDHAGRHEWTGEAMIGAEARDSVEAAAAARAAGRPLTDLEARGAYATAHVTAHEVAHGVNPIPEELFEGADANLEEALAEEVSHPIALARLRAQGQHDVAEWVATHPDELPVRGVYLPERGALASLLDRAGVTDPPERLDLIAELKFRTPPAERMAVLADHLVRSGDFETWDGAYDHVTDTLASRDLKPRGALPPDTRLDAPASPGVGLEDRVEAAGLRDPHEAARELQARAQVRPAYRDMGHLDLLKVRDRQRRQLRRVELDRPDDVEAMTQRRRMIEEITTEVELRKRAATQQRRMQAREQSERTGVLAVTREERDDLLYRARGDVYADHDLVGPHLPKPAYRPDLFIRSDLSGKPMRHYVTLPDGRRAHPDELTDALRRGRILVAEDLPRPPGERPYLTDLLSAEDRMRLERLDVGRRWQVREKATDDRLFLFDRALAREAPAPQDKAAAEALRDALNVGDRPAPRSPGTPLMTDRNGRPLRVGDRVDVAGVAGGIADTGYAIALNGRYLRYVSDRATELHDRERETPHSRATRSSRPAPASPGTTTTELTVADLKAGDHVEANGALQRIVNVRSPGVVELERDGLVLIDRATVPGVPGDPPAPDHTALGLPDLPASATDDRYEVRYGPDASIELLDRRDGTVTQTWREWDLDDVAEVLRARNAEARPAPPATAGPDYDAVSGLLDLARPGDGRELLPGFVYDPDLARSEARGDTLALPPGFFGLSKPRREAVLFRHLGRRLTDLLGADGIERLPAGEDKNLLTRKSLANTYYALNGPSRSEFAALHPDAARAVAAAALQHGLPLHPDSAALAGRPPVVEEPEAEHPAHDLARRVLGTGTLEGRGLLLEAGYVFAAHDDDRQVFRNHAAGAQITVRFNGEHEVYSATADVLPPIPDTERVELLQLRSDEAIARFEREGYAPNYTSVGEWLEFVHRDGRGRAVRLRDTGPTMDVVDAVAFTPSGPQIADAQRLAVARDPLGTIRPGDHYEPIKATLERGGIHWRLIDGQHDPPDGTFAAFRSARTATDVIVLRLGRQDDRNVVTEVGWASLRPERRGQVLTQDEHDAEVRQHDEDELAARVERQRADAERKRADATAGDDVDRAVKAGDAKALKAALGARDVSAATSFLVGKGYELRARRRSGRGMDRKINYTLRGPDGATIKLAGSQSWANRDPVEKVQIIANPQGGNRDRLPAGQAPSSLPELLVDALGRADELGQRYDAGVHVTTIIEGGVSRGAAAHHEWNGSIAIRKSHEGKRIKEYLAARKTDPGRLTDDDHLGFYNAVQIIQHEVNHGVGARGDQQGGLAFGSVHYRGHGKEVEEFLTEETAHLLVADWLRSWGMTEVLAAVKRNPRDRRVLGTYQSYRVEGKRIFDDAGLDDGQRRDLMIRMKFQMTPAERNAELTRLAGADNLHQALYADPRRRFEMSRNFEPVVRADLDDVDAIPRATAADGRRIESGDTVEVDTSEGKITGVVVAVMGYMAQVERADGLTLWTDVRRIH
jgi:hypothetical protein